MAARYFITLAICFQLSACVTGGVDAVDPSNSDPGGRVHIQSVEQAENGALSVAFKIVNDTKAPLCFYDAQDIFLRELKTADMRWSIFNESDGLCCANTLKDSLSESSVVAVMHEQT